MGICKFYGSGGTCRLIEMAGDFMFVYPLPDPNRCTQDFSQDICLCLWYEEAA